jgi:uncharacterized membrane protein
MSSGFALALAFGIGFVAGVRSLTAPAVTSWGAHVGRLNLAGTPLAFMASKWTAGIFTLLALVELVADQLPKTPARTTAVPLGARIVMGLLTGACFAVAGGASLFAGALIGAVGAVVGAFAGYRARVGLVRGLKVPDFVIAIPEDLVAIGLAVFFVTRF